MKLPHLDDDNAHRRWAAGEYCEPLAGLPLTLPPDDPPAMQSVHHLFVVEVAERDRVRKALSADGIATGIHYPTPVHLQPGWGHLGYWRGDLPATERLAQRVLSLPIFERVVEALGTALDRLVP